MRNVLITVLLAALLAGVGAYALGIWQPTADNWLGIPTWDAPPIGDERTERPTVAVGGPLYKPAPKFLGSNDSLPGPVHTPDPIVLGGHVVIRFKQEVRSQPDGKILFVGKEIDKQNPNARAAGPVETVQVFIGDKLVEKTYQRWNETNVVASGDMVAMLDFGLAFQELAKAKTRTLQAEQEYQVAVVIHEEATKQWQRAEQLYRENPTAIALEEFGLRRLGKERTKHDMLAKAEAKRLGEIDEKKAAILYQQHILRNEMTGKGMIRTIYKHRGEVVQAKEPILELVNIEDLRAEGLVEAQFLSRLDEVRRSRDLKVSIEPVYEQAPWRVLKGHMEPVNSIAFTSHPQAPFIVSGSEDMSVMVWSPYRRAALRRYQHDAPVRVVACSPWKDGKANLVLAGCANGDIYLWDLDSNKSEPKWVKRGEHSYGVTALAFSPDGKYFASGGEDKNIKVWETATGTLRYAFAPDSGVELTHEGPITSLRFTPQCQLVSASRDKTLKVWSLHEKGAKLERAISGRDGNVGDLDVDLAGRFMLLDKGRKLHLLLIADGRNVSQLDNPSAAVTFDTLARFSPDASLLLTAGGPDGRLHLWRTPTEGGRGIELRQWVTKEGSAVTCAAFSPDAGAAGAGFAASGSRNGNVYVWNVPDRAAWESHAIRNLKLDQIDRTLTSGNQVRIGVNFRNPVDEQHPDGRLVPGAAVKIVIEP